MIVKNVSIVLKIHQISNWFLVGLQHDLLENVSKLKTGYSIDH